MRGLTCVSGTGPAGSQRLQGFAQSTVKACAPPNVLHPHSTAPRDADNLTNMICFAACGRAQRGCWTGSSTDRDLSESTRISAQTRRHCTMRRQCGPGCHGALEGATRSCSEIVARHVGNASLRLQEFSRILAFERSGSLCQQLAISCTQGGSHAQSAHAQLRLQSGQGSSRAMLNVMWAEVAMYGMFALLLQTTLEQHGSLSMLAYNMILILCLLSK